MTETDKVSDSVREAVEEWLHVLQPHWLREGTSPVNQKAELAALFQRLAVAPVEAERDRWCQEADARTSTLANVKQLERARWIAFAEKHVREAEERFSYFDSGPGWRTHCAGATGAEAAARYWKERKNVWENVLEAMVGAND